MGNILSMCTSCCKESTSYEDLTPDMVSHNYCTWTFLLIIVIDNIIGIVEG